MSRTTARLMTDKPKRIVVKIGSALLVDPARGTVHRQWLETLAEDVQRLHAAGHQVAIVSSGAIAVGRRYLDLADPAHRQLDADIRGMRHEAIRVRVEPERFFHFQG